ncbi:MAG: discoidin domain-containing protein, partial [Aquificaceae bacterium]|nr:discoidin domain-containing protein [Aquificaceae bacterium]
MFRSSTALRIREVPKMTSETEPEGVVSASNYVSGNWPWCAFDKNVATFWMGTLRTNEWLAYQFTAPVFVHTVSLLVADTIACPRNVQVQKSEDGVNWIDATSILILKRTTDLQNIFVSSAGFASMWRLLIRDTYGAAPAIGELNFIGFEQLQSD